MATMIPVIDPAMIQNDGERLVYLSALELPADYTVNETGLHFLIIQTE